MLESVRVRQVRVLHVAETIRGGIATYFNELHDHQIKEFGIENIHYVVPSAHRSDLIGISPGNIVEFKRTGRNIASLYRMAKVTIAEIKRFKPDIVHLHSSFAGLIVRSLLFAVDRSIRIIYCPHGWSFSREAPAISNWTTRLTELALSGVTDRIICISNNEYQWAAEAGIAARKLALVRSGINVDRNPPKPTRPVFWPAKAMRVLFIGRLDRQKGYDILVAAARKLGAVVDVRLIGSAVVGDEALSLDLPDNVTLLGWLNRDEIEAQLDLADLVVIPSRWEAFGLVTLEAMRASKPVVAFAVGALPEIVEDGATGILCKPADVDALVEGLKAAAKKDLPAAGLAGHERLSRFFNIENTHAKLVRTYEDVLGEKSLTPGAANSPANAQK